MNIQRDIIYTQRRKVLDGDNVRDNIIDMITSACEMIVDTYRQEIDNGTVNKSALENEIRVSLNIDTIDELSKERVNSQKLLEEITEKAISNYEEKEQDIGEEIRQVERVVLLKTVDSKWMDHIDNMDELKNGIGLRAYGQKDPVVQYRFEGGEMFDEMISQIKLEVAKIMLHIVKTSRNTQMTSSVKVTSEGLDNSVANAMNSGNNVEAINNKTEKAQPIVNDGPKVGRNDPCPCGSGKKYKNCCGKNA